MHYLGQLPDLPLPHSGQRLHTRRKAVAQIVLCQGCCCGQTVRGLPGVPLDYLKPLWKSEKLNKTVQLTVSGCLGPCDLPNVCCIVTPDEQAWYGRLTTQEDYAVLVNWARQCRERGEVLPLPGDLAHLRFERWPGDDDPTAITPIAQEPGDIVLLSAADTDLAVCAAAAASLPKGFPSIRALNLDRLRDRAIFDAYIDDVLQEARVIVLRVLGGTGYWREQIEAIHILAQAHGIALICAPGDAQLDLELTRFNTVSLSVANTVWRYFAEGGVSNAAAMFRYIGDKLLGTAFGAGPPSRLPEVGIYFPGESGAFNLEQWRERYFDPTKQGTVAVVFYRSHWTTGNLTAVDALIRDFAGCNVLPVFGPNLGTVLDSGLLLPNQIDLVVSTTSFSLGNGSLLENLDVPVLQAVFSSSSENVWASNIAGLSPRDLAMNVALPEMDGRINTTAVAFKNTKAHDSLLQTEIACQEPRPDRVAHVTCLAQNWVRLRKTPNGEKRIAILLANYPSKNARVGNAVGLDTPASLHALLLALRDAGYDVGSQLPANGQALIEALISASLADYEFASAAAHARSAGQLSPANYRRSLEKSSPSVRKGIETRWGQPEQSPQFFAEQFAIPGLLFGSVFIGIQPARGYDQDPAAVYHSPDLPPTPFYFAFYEWIRSEFGAHAVIHLGKHGNLEWLPGKSVALSAACYPEAVLRELPNIYPYIINNPGEGTQAKRRTSAVIVDHLIPPMTRADSHGELRQLEALLDEYYAVQGLDPTKVPLVLERIGQLMNVAQLHRDLGCSASPSAEELPGLLAHIDSYLCEIKEAQIRDGLHVLGQVPSGDQLIDLLLSLVRVDNGLTLALPKAIYLDHGGQDYEQLARDPAASFVPEKIGASGPLRTCGDAITFLNDEARRIIAHCWQTQTAAAVRPRTQQTLEYLWKDIWPRLQKCSEEIEHVLKALAGRFVPPGPSGAPTRGSADILPTGRNFYSLDIRAVPTPTAWRVGCAAANALAERHRERTGAYPESVAWVVWGTSNMRTGGDDIACILALLGVRPVWDSAKRRVLGIEAISLVELERPRIDVMIRISGLFRDAFPNLVRLLNDAVALVSRLNEPLDRNFVKAHVALDVAALVRTSVPEEEASRLAGLRVFGSKPGAYGAGLLPLIDGRNWETPGDLANVYMTWSSYAYTGSDNDGREEKAAFRLRLSQTEVVAQNQDNREHDIFDSDDYFQFHGGLVAAVRAIKGTAPEAYIGDTSRPDDVRARTLREESYRVFRSRVINPKWLAGVMRHGYKGAVEMAATVDYLFGYDATAEILDDWMYERLAATYLFDEKVQEFLRQNNPWAERAMIERLLEAAQRGLWEQPDPATLDRLRQQYGSNDARLEGMPDSP